MKIIKTAVDGYAGCQGCIYANYDNCNWQICERPPEITNTMGSCMSDNEDEPFYILKEEE